MRSQPSILHLDLDAFFASVEQRDKPSLRGKPVVVGGLGPRGVVSTASYEARRFGVRSAMRTAEARARCPHAAYLTGRFDAYRDTSRAVLRVLREITEVIEPLSLDEAFVDLAAGGYGAEPDTDEVRRIATELKQRVREVTGGLTGTVGAGSSKLIAKIASDLDKPDGLTVVPPGTELDFLHPMPVTVIPGVGPATNERLRRLGVRTVADLARVDTSELVSLLGQAHGRSLARLARAQDDREVEYIRESKSISVEDTFDQDITDPVHLDLLVRRMAERVTGRLSESGTSGRTVTVKVRLFDFSTHTRSATLPGPTDDLGTITRLACRLLREVDTSDGVRLLGVGVSGLADWVQDDLFSTRRDPFGSPVADPSTATDTDATGETTVATDTASTGGEGFADGEFDQPSPSYPPGSDVRHARHGPGWVWGSGLGRVTVRFETARTGPGPVRTFLLDDPELGPATTWDPDGTSDAPD